MVSEKERNPLQPYLGVWVGDDKLIHFSISGEEVSPTDAIEKVNTLIHQLDTDCRDIAKVVDRYKELALGQTMVLRMRRKALLASKFYVTDLKVREQMDNAVGSFPLQHLHLVDAYENLHQCLLKIPPEGLSPGVREILKDIKKIQKRQDKENKKLKAKSK